MNLFVLVMAVMLSNGQGDLMVRGSPEKPDTFQSKEACEKQKEADIKEVKPEMDKAGAQFEIQCVSKKDYDKMMGKGGPGA